MRRRFARAGNSMHGFFTGALLRQLRRPRRPGAKTLDLLDAPHGGRSRRPHRSRAAVHDDGAGRLRIPILRQTALPFGD